MTMRRLFCFFGFHRIEFWDISQCFGCRNCGKWYAVASKQKCEWPHCENLQYPGSELCAKHKSIEESEA